MALFGWRAAARANGFLGRRRLRPARALALTVTPAGAVAAGGYGSAVLLLAPELSRRLQRLPAADTVRALCTCELGEEELLAVAFRGRRVDVHARPRGALDQTPFDPEPRARWRAHAAMIETAAFLSPGVLATGSRDGTVGLWDALTGRAAAAPLPAGAAVQGIVALGDGRLAVSLLDGRLQRWSVPAERPDAEDGTGLRRLTAFAAWADRDVVAAAGADGKVVALDARRFEPLWHETLPTAWITALAVDQAGALLAAGGGDGRVWLLDPHVGDVVAEIAPIDRDRPVTALAFARDGALLALHDGRVVSRWRPAPAEPWALLRRFAGRPGVSAELRAAVEDAAARDDPRPLGPWIHRAQDAPYRDAGAREPELGRRLRAAVERLPRREART